VGSLSLALWCARLAVIGAGAAGALQGQRAYRVAGPFDSTEYECAGTLGGLVEISDGTSLILCVRSNELQVIDWSGNRSRQLGQRGGGPGEYRLIERLAEMNGDSALLYDVSSRRYLIATPRGLRDWPGGSGERRTEGGFMGADKHGRILALDGFRFRANRGASQPKVLAVAESILVIVRRPGRGVSDTIARVRGPSRRLVPFTMSVGVGRGTVPAELGNPALGADEVTMFPDGWIAIAYLDPYRVDWIRPDGVVIRGRPIDPKKVKLDQDLKKVLLRIAFGDANKDLAPSTFDDWPDFLPPFTRIGSVQASDPLVQVFDGRLMIARTQRSLEGGKSYDVVNRRGEREGVLTTPPGMSVLHVGQRNLYAVVVDSDDVRHLRRYPRPFH